MLQKLIDEIAEYFVLILIVLGVFTVVVVGQCAASKDNQKRLDAAHKMIELEIIKEQVKLEQLKQGK